MLKKINFVCRNFSQQRLQAWREQKHDMAIFPKGFAYAKENYLLMLHWDFD